MSVICMVVVALVTMAMVVVLSAFNGIDSLIDERYSYFDTDISILPLTSKVIKAGEMNCDEIKAIDGVASCHRVIEERVFAEYDNNQRIVKVKGVEKGFFPQSRLDTMIIGGKGVMELENNPAAIVGVGVKYDLDLQLFEQVFNPLRLSAVVRGKNLRRDMEQALNKKNIPVAGIFSINIDFDSEYVIVPIDFAADLLGYSDEVSMLELQLSPGANLADVKTEIENLLGADYQVRTRYEKNELIYKTNRTEKWATFLIMGFILLIATFNIIAALTLLINEKRDDIKTLASLGAPASLIKRVFFFEGALINFVGALVGLVLGFLFVILQQNLGLIRLEGGLVPYYPVEIALPDLLAVFGLVLTCGILSSILPVQFFTRKYTDL
ncbi:MAG: ABC transporter permease [Cryomorphaceae bacterium]|nr:ABC transporter permease [Flavobacteriales bacterium]